MISSLEHLEKNRFETANAEKTLFNDVERYGGSVSVLKAIGRDLIRNERKFSLALKPFKFNDDSHYCQTYTDY